jgi:chromosome segregation ATPase
MSEERILRLENAMATLAELAANTQGRVTRLEEAYVTVVELLRSHHDGMTELRAAQADADGRIAALADAQIRADERVQTALTQLAESQAHTDRRLDALIDIVRSRLNGQPENPPE